ncbi:MAG: transcriptional regulator [Proteobacteria bacterium SG_bin7]|nr:MAG: transcriptional regulator [Proteobacteria bacterium SG_bin7]
MKLKLLVVDDDKLIHESIKMAVPTSWEVTFCSSLNQLPNNTFDAAIVDMHLTEKTIDPEGIKIISLLVGRQNNLEVIAISGDLNSELLESCLKAGASRFLPKPLSPEELVLTLEKIEALSLLKKASLRPHNASTRWIGTSPASDEIRKKIANSKSEWLPVLIEGESGTGKEVVATLLHNQEPERPWVQLNVAAIPENLFESEFFGHVKGAFTGADQNKMGIAEMANNGDLFLDEIEALPLEHQAKLLRFLESGEIRRVGGKNSMTVKVRVIAATNRNLHEMVKSNVFREDLLWRLQGNKITLPPLRNRFEDIGAIAEFFILSQRPRYNKQLTPEAINVMKAYQWPGNIRELKRICEQLCINSPLPMIRPSDVEILLPTTSDLSLGLDGLLRAYESQILRTSLGRVKDVEEAAKLLKISRSTLYKKLKDNDITVGV